MDELLFVGVLGILLGFHRRLLLEIPPIELVVAAVLAVFIAPLLVLLIRELGRAVVVRRLTGRPAVMEVGPSPWVEVGGDRVQWRLSKRAPIGGKYSVACRWQFWGLSWQTRTRIALAGPVTDLVVLLVLLGVGRLGLPGAALQLVWLYTVWWLALGLAVNLAPIKSWAAREPGRMSVPDGRMALKCWQAGRRGAAIDPVDPPPPPNPAAA